MTFEEYKKLVTSFRRRVAFKASCDVRFVRASDQFDAEHNLRIAQSKLLNAHSEIVKHANEHAIEVTLKSVFDVFGSDE